MTPPLADRLRAEGIEFADAAGNVYIDQPPVLVFVKGGRPAALPTVAEPGRAFLATGLQVLFVLLRGRNWLRHPTEGSRQRPASRTGRSAG